MKKFYICRHCGNQVEMVHDAKVPVFCCGQKMEYLEPNTVEASSEKHLPVVSVENGVVKVNVGSVDHPMVAEHYIEWVCVESDEGLQFKKLNPNASPRVSFSLSKGDKVEAVYAFCNLHSLWKS